VDDRTHCLPQVTFLNYFVIDGLDIDYNNEPTVNVFVGIAVLLIWLSSTVKFVMFRLFGHF